MPDRGSSYTYRRSTPDEIERIEKLWWDGSSLVEMSEILGRDRSTIRWHIRTKQLTRNPELPPKKPAGVRLFGKRIKISITRFHSPEKIKTYKDYVIEGMMRDFFTPVHQVQRICQNCHLRYDESQFTIDPVKAECNECHEMLQRMRTTYIDRTQYELQ